MRQTRAGVRRHVEEPTIEDIVGRARRATRAIHAEGSTAHKPSNDIERQSSNIVLAHWTYMLKPGGGSVMVPGVPEFALCGEALRESANVKVRRERDEMRALNIARSEILRENWREMGDF